MSSPMNKKKNKKSNIQRFGAKLQTLRNQHGLTLQQTASLLGLSAHSHILAIESGQKLPSLELVLAIARLFNVTTDQLLKDELELEINDAGQNMESPSPEPESK